MDSQQSQFVLASAQKEGSFEEFTNTITKGGGKGGGGVKAEGVGERGGGGAGA